jgi:hypothetical protein
MSSSNFAKHRLRYALHEEDFDFLISTESILVFRRQAQQAGHPWHLRHRPEAETYVDVSSNF